ncbi:MAG: metallophosphoesterase [Candidatus Woesearchaeota archaeon]
MKEDPNIELISHGLYLKKEKVLVIADLHLGYEEMLSKQGVLLPRFELKDMLQELEKIFKKTGEVEKVVITGDLKHEFGIISSQEWREILQLFDFLSKNSKEIILIVGNHDVALGPIASKRNLEIKESFVVGNYLIVHGDFIEKSPDKKTIIIGHEHPAVILREENRTEKYKCFLVGKWKKHRLIVLPSFNPIAEGSDILSGNCLSPYLQQSLDNFSAYVIGDKLYYFDRLKKLKKMK